ncbi:hypothetical protein DPMN_111940 [Dreissena polymorpha]|uniref:Prokineticin domain-containing protein n=2 Tax=Dreissena polymorpha TaxID=45954 RepID=A0A9D4QQF0_DREPO|nr:hypothetical protein DPMN_111940 [Dreissena polymorpha]
MNRVESFVLVLAASLAVVWAAGCSSDADCPGGCCYSNNVNPHGKCYSVSNDTQPCHLPNHQVNHMLYPCGCASGLTCDAIHFDPSLPDPIHDAEILLLGHGYGLCTSTPGTIFG